MSCVGKMCPMLKKTCIEHQCAFFVHLLGTNPQTGVGMDKFDCTFAFLPILLIENSQMQRQTGAAVESFRNESVRNAQMQAAGMLALASAGGDPKTIQAGIDALAQSQTPRLNHQ